MIAERVQIDLVEPPRRDAFERPSRSVASLALLDPRNKPNRTPASRVPRNAHERDARRASGRVVGVVGVGLVRVLGERGLAHAFNSSVDATAGWYCGMPHPHMLDRLLVVRRMKPAAKIDEFLASTLRAGEQRVAHARGRRSEGQWKVITASVVGGEIAGPLGAKLVARQIEKRDRLSRYAAQGEQIRLPVVAAFVLTTERLFVLEMNSGAKVPREVVGEIPLAAISRIETKGKVLTTQITLELHDGQSLRISSGRAPSSMRREVSTFPPAIEAVIAAHRPAALAA